MKLSVLMTNDIKTIASRSLIHTDRVRGYATHPTCELRGTSKPTRSNCIFHPVGQKYQNSNQAVWIPFSVVPLSAK